jgi:hypothetical protein
LQWLREGDRGRYLESLTGHQSSDATSRDFVHEALQQGALLSLKVTHADLGLLFHRESLTKGLLGAICELHVDIQGADDAQLAALGLVRQLPALTKLEVRVCGKGQGGHPVLKVPVPWPPFIPPSLKVLCIDEHKKGFLRHSPLRALPGMLEASGVRLERLEATIPWDFEAVGDTLGYLAQALRCCSPTLRGFVLSIESKRETFVLRVKNVAPAPFVERLRVQWADLLHAVSACRELQVLVLPRCSVECSFPPGTAFSRLTELEVPDHGRERPPDAGAIRLWELMASGGLPALAKLSVGLGGRWGGVEEVRTRVAPAFEAVAGTLTHLYLDKSHGCKFQGDEVGVAYELGAAMGKLRRLKDLGLDLSSDGRVYHSFAQGLTSSEEGHPPVWRLVVHSSVIPHDADLLASLVLPSVRVFGGAYCFHQSLVALIIACAVGQTGYKHVMILDPNTKMNCDRFVYQAVVGCTVGDTVIDHHFNGWSEHTRS